MEFTDRKDYWLARLRHCVRLTITDAPGMTSTFDGDGGLNGKDEECSMDKGF